MPVELTRIPIDWNKGDGTVASVVTITMLDAGGNTIEGGDVWITRGVDPNANIAGGASKTDANGKARFLLDLGTTYHLWFRKVGYVSIFGSVFVAQPDMVFP